MAFTTTVLNWGLLEFANSYNMSGETNQVLRAIKWTTDYFIKCHVEDFVVYGQVWFYSYMSI